MPGKRNPRGVALTPVVASGVRGQVPRKVALELLFQKSSRAEGGLAEAKGVGWDYKAARSRITRDPREESPRNPRTKDERRDWCLVCLLAYVWTIYLKERRLGVAVYASQIWEKPCRVTDGGECGHLKSVSDTRGEAVRWIFGAQ